MAGSRDVHTEDAGLDAGTQMIAERRRDIPRRGSAAGPVGACGGSITYLRVVSFWCMNSDGLGADAIRATVDLIDRRVQPAAILLYGSAATGRTHASSDVDLALLVGGALPDAFALAALRVDLAALLGRDVDVVLLDTASPILAMEVLRHHRPLTNRRPALLDQFLAKTLSAYFDLKRVRRPIEAMLLQPLPRA